MSHDNDRKKFTIEVCKDSGAPAVRLALANVAGDRSLLEILEDNNLPLPYGCREGVCGSCVVRITGGADLLSAPRPVEKDTLSRIPDPAGKRLACRACITPGAHGLLILER